MRRRRLSAQRCAINEASLDGLAEADLVGQDDAP
jgi:hypothetical protein